MTRYVVRAASWRPLCLPLPPLPSSPQLLTTSGYTCSVEFRFQTERCITLVFCRTSIKSKHTLSLGGPVVREGEAPTACCTRTPLKPHPLLLPPTEPSSPPHRRQLTCYHNESRFKNVISTGGRRSSSPSPASLTLYATSLILFSASDSLMQGEHST